MVTVPPRFGRARADPGVDDARGRRRGAAPAPRQQRGQAHPGQSHRRRGRRAPGQERPPVVSIRGVSHRSPSPSVGRAAPWAPLARHGRRHAAARAGHVRPGRHAGRVGTRPGTGRSSSPGRARTRSLPWRRSRGHRCDGIAPPSVRRSAPAPWPDAGARRRRPGGARPATGSATRGTAAARRGPRPARAVVGRGDLSWGAAHRGGAVARGPGRGGRRARGRARVRQRRPSPCAAVATRVHQGLLGWDAGWYESIARHGYAGAGHCSLRFFPLVPLLTRAVSSVPGVGVGAALVVVANVSAFVAVVLLAVLARRETGDDALARRAAWLLCLAPAAFTQVMGYAEGTFLALSVGDHAGPARPGVVVGGRPGPGRRRHPARGRAPRGPRRDRGAAGPGARRTGAPRRGRAGGGGRARRSASAPSSAGWGGATATPWPRCGSSSRANLRGGVTDPLRTLAHDASLLVHGRHLGSALHLPWALLAVALLVVTLRRWPVAYGAFAAAVLVVALTASNLDGFERYALSAFPLVLAGATRDVGAARASGPCSPWPPPAWPCTPCWPSPTCTCPDRHLRAVDRAVTWVSGASMRAPDWPGSGVAASR